MALEGIDYSHPQIWNTSQALNPREVPNKLVIVGGGVTGLGLATFYSKMGSEVTVLELKSRILSNYMDQRASQELQRIFEKKGLTFITNSSLRNICYQKEKLILTVGGSEIAADTVVVALGRKPNTNSIQFGLKRNAAGGLSVNSYMETSISYIYAAGDVVGPPLLAHKAMHEGIIAAENAMGLKSIMNYELIPSCIYTIPEIAMVGRVRAKGDTYKK